MSDIFFSESLLVSVIIPVYNCEGVLHYSIDSVLKQTYKNIEIILIDDGSTDSSGNICDAYKEQDSRVTVYHKNNGGVSEARNLGMEAANGYYIMFVDADDYISEFTISQMISVAHRYEADIVTADYVRSKTYDHTFKIEQDINVSLMNAEQFVSTSKGNQRVNICCKLYKSSIISKYRFPVGFVAEDEYFSGMVLTDESVKQIALIRTELYCYVENDKSLSHNYSIEQYISIENILDQLYKSVKEKTNKKYFHNIYLLLYISKTCGVKYNLIMRNAFTGSVKERFRRNQRKYCLELWKSEISLNKKIIYTLIFISNSVYRRYIIFRDPTIKTYERMVKQLMVS